MKVKYSYFLPEMIFLDVSVFEENLNMLRFPR